MEKSQICDETISLILRSCYRDVSRESIVNKNARYPRCSFSRTASSRGSVGAILRRAIRCRLSWLHSVFIADASVRCKVHANTLYVTTKPTYFPRANSQRNTRGDVIDRDAGEPFRLRLVLYNFPKNPCPRIELSYPPPRAAFLPTYPVGKFNFLPLLSQHFDCRNHIRVIQPMGDGNRLYMCGTNAHSPKDWVIYVSIRMFVLHFHPLLPCSRVDAFFLLPIPRGLQSRTKIAFSKLPLCQS